MSFTQLGKGGVPGTPYTSGSPDTYQDWERLRLNCDTFQSRLLALEALLQIKIATVTLTNAQIKALPTTPIALVASPGVGNRIKVLAASLSLDASAGAYTNINTTAAYLMLAHVNATGQWLIDGVNNDSGVTLTDLTQFLGAARAALLDFSGGTHRAIQAAASGDELWVLSALPSGANASAYYSNKSVVIAADNNGSGDFTGGNAANTLKAVVYYAIEAL